MARESLVNGVFGEAMQREARHTVSVGDEPVAVSATARHRGVD